MIKWLPYFANAALMYMMLVSFLLICMILYIYFLRSTIGKASDPDKAEIPIARFFQNRKNKKPRQ